jgi:hypothetical protein
MVRSGLAGFRGYVDHPAPDGDEALVMAATRYPILVLGGYGVFGAKICRRLAKDPAIRIIIAGRSLEKAEALVSAIRSETPGAEVEARAVILPEGLAAALGDLGPQLVIHNAGPFQGQDYAVPKACIEGGVDYLDLADDREFVAGFDVLDAAARSKGVLAVSGVSTLPGLSSTIVALLKPRFSRMRRIAMGIVPANRMPRGLAVVEAILSYTGKPVPRWSGGKWSQVYGWQELGRRRVAGPTIGDLGPRWLAVCDVADNVILPKLYPDLEEVTFRAGLELPLLHLGLWSLSWLVRTGIVPSLRPWAPLFRKVAEWLDGLGSERGGMFVEISGDDTAGQPITHCWNLIAGSGEGPWIPTLPSIILARKLARGEVTRKGAMACLDLFTLDDFHREAADLDIHDEIL